MSVKLLDIRATDGLGLVSFPCRYVKLSATGNDGVNWWGLYELNLTAPGGGNLSRTGWTVTAFRTSSGAAANLKDGNNTTFWQNGGIPVTSGASQDWIKVDGGVGADLSIGGVLADAIAGAVGINPTAGDIDASANNERWIRQASWVSGNIVSNLLTKTFTQTTQQSAIVPRVGGACTFGRAAAANETQSGGGTVSRAAGVPRVSYYQDPVTSLWVPCYQLQTVDDCAFAYTSAPQQMTVFLDFYEEVASTTATGRVVCFGDSSGGGGPSLRIYRVAGTYQAVWHNGTTPLTSVATVSWAIGDRIRLRIILNTDGSCQIGATVNNAAEVLGTATIANTIGATWNQLVVTAGADYNKSSKGQQGFRSIQAATGVLTAFPGDAVRGMMMGQGTRRATRQEHAA